MLKKVYMQLTLFGLLCFALGFCWYILVGTPVKLRQFMVFLGLDTKPLDIYLILNIATTAYKKLRFLFVIVSSISIVIGSFIFSILIVDMGNLFLLNKDTKTHKNFVKIFFGQSDETKWKIVNSLFNLLLLFGACYISILIPLYELQSIVLALLIILFIIFGTFIVGAIIKKVCCAVSLKIKNNFAWR